MNKNIKRIIAMSLAVTAISTITPIQKFKFLNFSNAAYASDDDDDDDYDADTLKASYLDDLSISGADDDISFSEKKLDYTIKIDKDIESITVKAEAKDAEDQIKIDGEDVALDSNNVAKKEISLDKGRNLIRIKLVTEDYGLRIYNLVVNRGSADGTKSDSDEIYLNNIELSDGNISFAKATDSYNVNVASSVNEMRITAQPEDDDYEVKIDGVRVDKDEDYRRKVELSSGNNQIFIDIEDSQGDSKTYTLNINRGGTTEVNTSEVIDNTQDSIYLDDIVIQDGAVPLNFKPKVTAYAVDVADDVQSILFKAKPEYDDRVFVNNNYSKDSYVRRINLNEGKNVITVKIDNGNTYDKGDEDYEERTYNITVYRGTSQGTSKTNQQAASQGTSSQSSQQNNTSANLKINQWVQANGKWQYNDSTGNPVKNMWVQNYYIQPDGNMATNWITYNGSWYYLGSNGSKKTGWQSVNGNWYYLNQDGKMETGWIKDGSGKYYYLNTDGSMAHDITIDGYKLGSDGAWNNK